MSVFHFRQFSINQSGAAMKVGTDGMLLGAWIQPENAKRILDIGTGTGVLSLMLAQRSDATFDAIEIDEKAFLQAKQNFENSPWQDRLNPIHTSLKNFAETNSEKYDLIVSNPPFFEKANEGNNPIKITEQRALARTTDTLPLEELAKCSAKLLAPRGKLFVILPYDSAMEFIALASKNNLHLQEKLSIKSRKDRNIIRVILGFGFDKPQEIAENEFVIYEDINQYSNQYIGLTKEYHKKDFTPN